MTGARTLVFDERAEIDAKRIEALVESMGRFAAERMIGRAIEEIDWRLTDARHALRNGDSEGFATAMRHLMPVANAIGLPAVSRVAGDAAHTTATRDSAALGATFARLERLCDGVVPAIGDAWAARS